MGSKQWQMDNHRESLQGEKLINRRLWSGEKLSASPSQDFVSFTGLKPQPNLQSMRTCGQCPTFCYAEMKPTVYATDLKQIPPNNNAIR